MEAKETKMFKRQYAPHRRVSYRICRDCGHMYVLTDSDAVHYITTYGQLPLRCEECRKRVRENGEISDDAAPEEVSVDETTSDESTCSAEE